MAMFKCKMCGGDLALTEGSPLVECEYCGSLQTVPSADNEKKLTLFSRANRLRFGCEFDKAAGVYEALVADFPEEAEAFWGLVLCKYGIEYVDDPASHKKIPTCHRSSFDSVMDDSDFEQTLENADPLARKVYREEAKQIEELRKGILEVSSKEDPYDIFICYKETAENGERTLDSVLAQDVYDALTDKGYRVFFSRITLEDKLGQEYEPYIFAALNSAKVMLAFGTDYEYFNAVWVRNEWSRYLKLMEADKNKHLIPCYKGIDAYDMPKEFAKLQAQDLGKVGAVQDLLRGIDKLITPTVNAAPIAVNPGANIAELLNMGKEALEKGEWEIASNQFDLALVADPKSADAHLGKLLAERKCKERSLLAKAKKPFNKIACYKQAVTYADDALKQELEDYCRIVKRKWTQRIVCTVITCVLSVTAALVAAVVSLEVMHNNVVKAVHAGSISMEDAYQKFSQWDWYKQPDGYTQFLIERELPGTYPNYFNPASITIPDSVTSIDNSMFADCSNLVSVTIPDSVTSIGDYVFSGCTNLTSITIPDSVTSIGQNAFRGCNKLTSITIPDSVTSIGISAFYNCTGLTSITVPNGVTSIADSAFNGCESLTSIIIPNSVTSIGFYAFRCCSNLASVTISDSVTSIGDYAFLGCGSIQDVYYSGTQSQRNAMSISMGNGSLARAQWHYEHTGE